MKNLTNFTLLFTFLCFSSSVYSAGACTYREAIMALERGNAVRGMTLMRMAHRDGDKRASQYLVSKDYPIELTAAASDQQDNYQVSLGRVYSR